MPLTTSPFGFDYPNKKRRPSSEFERFSREKILIYLGRNI
jgi:hypothetical protein